MILYFTPGGRLGNQLFQLAILVQLAGPGEVCITTRMEEVLEVMDTDLGIRNVPAGTLYRLLDRIFVPFLLKPLVSLGVFSRVSEDGKGGLRRRRGLLKRVQWVEGYFQRQSFVSPALRTRLRIKEALRHQALGILETLPAGTPKVFVHVRRTDYLSFFVRGTVDPTLPISYYEGRLDEFRSVMPKSFFIFLSDDPDWVQETFASVPDKLVSRNTPGVDLALMTLCSGGVLSNSSLSWWGAFLMKPDAPRFCPRYWLGWKSRAWHPEGIEPSFAVAVDVAES